MKKTTRNSPQINLHNLKTHQVLLIRTRITYYKLKNNPHTRVITSTLIFGGLFYLILHPHPIAALHQLTQNNYTEIETERKQRRQTNTKERRTLSTQIANIASAIATDYCTCQGQ